MQWCYITLSFFFFFSSRRRHTRCSRDWSSDVCSSDLLGSLKSLNVQNVGPDVTQVLRRMGQDLLNPPDVSGWKGGATWLNATTLFERFNWGNRLSGGRDATKPYFADVSGQLQARG